MTEYHWTEGARVHWVIVDNVTLRLLQASSDAAQAQWLQWEQAKPQEPAQ